MFLLLFLAAIGTAQDLPITRLAGVTLRVADLAKARQFYGGMMGLEEAFQLDSCTFFKVNEDQYVEFCPGLTGSDPFRLERVSMLTEDIELLQRALEERKANPGAVARKADHNLHFSVADPDGLAIDFVQYVRGSPQLQKRPKSLETRPVSTHLLHVGVASSSEAAGMAFYRDKLGFRETLRGGPNPPEIRWIIMMMPGVYGDFVEMMILASQPPAAREHLCFEVEDIQVANKELLARGAPQGMKPFLAQNNHWILNFKDADGLRIEIMEHKAAK
jgi:catechol 2,3-dioxygenase-like lactoylglutathione lyase family enzyme